MKNLKAYIVILIVLFSLSAFSQYKKKDFFGKWKVTRVLDSKIEKIENKEEKLGLKKLIDDKTINGNYYVLLSKNSIMFFEGEKILEIVQIKKLLLIDNALEITFVNTKRKFILKNLSEGELVGDDVTHYLSK